MSFLFCYVMIGILGIVLFISIDVMGGLNTGSEKWNGVNPLKRFSEFWKEFKDDSSCLVTCKEGWKILCGVVLLWPLIILIVLFELYYNKNKNITTNIEDEENEKD